MFNLEVRKIEVVELRRSEAVKIEVTVIISVISNSNKSIINHMYNS